MSLSKAGPLQQGEDNRSFNPRSTSPPGPRDVSHVLPNSRRGGAREEHPPARPPIYPLFNVSAGGLAPIIALQRIIELECTCPLTTFVRGTGSNVMRGAARGRHLAIPVTNLPTR
jgi:hypothetical protein